MGFSVSESFPCIICGKTLRRACPDEFGYEAQPADGIMCESSGNYGSTVFDSMDGERLAFNICDPCMVKAGEQRRVMTYRKYRPILVYEGSVHGMVVGRENLRDRPYVPWNKDLARDDEPLYMYIDELENLPRSCELFMSLEDIRRMAAVSIWSEDP